MITRVTIAGMNSPYAVQAVFTALTPVPGIVRAEVVQGGAEIEHDGRATPELLREAIEVSGYAVTDVVEDRRRLL